jgi:replicative DNA helicase
MVDAELALIGSVLHDNDMLDDVSHVKPSHMDSERNAIVWQAVLDLYQSGSPVDSVMLFNELSRKGKVSEVGETYLVDAFSSVLNGRNARGYAGIVREHANKREMARLGSELIKMSADEQVSGRELIQTASDTFNSIAEESVVSTVVDVRSEAMGAVAAIEERIRSGVYLPGKPTGLVKLDQLIGGLCDGMVTIVAGRPAMGKTSFVLNLMDYVGWVLGEPILFFSLEMSKAEVLNKLFSLWTDVPYNSIRQSVLLTDVERMMLRDCAEGFVKRRSPMLIEDNPNMTMLDILAMARKQKRTTGLGLIVIDYLQLVSSVESRDSRQEQISKMSRQGKIMARELNVPVIMLSQLNRKAEGRDGHRPVMSDLRESGAIEQDADTILLLHRPEYYDPDSMPGIAEIIVPKNRHGAPGNIFTAFRAHSQRFENLKVMSDQVVF